MLVTYRSIRLLFVIRIIKITVECNFTQKLTGFAAYINIDLRNYPFFSFRTMQRPVPLEHCIYYQGELYKICEQSTFLPEGYRDAQKAHVAKTTKALPAPGVGSPGQGRGGAPQGRGGGPPGRGGGPGGRGGDNQGRGGGRRGPTSKQIAQGTIQTAMRGSGNGGGGWRSETSQWYTLINNLNKKGLLPVC